MKKIIYIAIGVIVLVLLGAWWYLTGVVKPSNTATSDVNNSVQTSDTVKASVPNAVGNTNPFQSDVNPVSGYQNPFAK